MKLNKYNIRLNPETSSAELVLDISVPLDLIDRAESMGEDEAVEILGSYILNFFKQIAAAES